MSQLTTLESLYVESLKDLYSAESQLIKALPRMAKAANSKALQKAFQTHLKQTEEQQKRLDRIFKDLSKAPRGKKCVAMEGLIEEGKELMQKDADPAVLDAALIAAAQKVEHYEMAAYGTARTWAEQLGRMKDAELLQTTLDEEGETDKLLTGLASEVNMVAEVQGTGQEEGNQNENEESSEDEENEENKARSNGKSNGFGKKLKEMFS